jgi:cytochrome oxidase Cu insertion factor (SCO1/SenC/PrrC family)
MGRALRSDNPTVVSAFHTALFHQVIVVLACLAVLAIAFNVLRTIQYRRTYSAGAGGGTTGGGSTDGGATGQGTAPGEPVAHLAEPMGRHVLRIGFGVLWILDGLLQLQASMPLGLPDDVVHPATAGAPGWVQHLVNSGLTVWTNHPVQAAASTVWIQIGLGLWLLVAPRGRWSRLGGLASAAWGAIVWMFGEAFGGLFAPGATWLFGLPGAVLFYVVAGILLALPERSWSTSVLGRRLLQVFGAFFVGMAILQAWPGRGFWQGTSAHGQGTLGTMVTQMAQTSQPHVLSSWVTAFAHFDNAHGWGVNLFVVLALLAIGAGLLTGQRRFVLPTLAAAAVLCLADWVLVEDFGWFGGTGTDPNSMLPMLLLIGAAYVALTRVPAPAVAPTPAAAPASEPAVTATMSGEDAPGAVVDGQSRRWWESMSPNYLFRAVAALGAVVIVLVGTAPMALAATNPNADPIITEALNGTPNVLDGPAPSFNLIDQSGHPVSLSSLHGHAVALTFLDPVCTTDCPLIAQDFRLADARLGASSSRVEMVAVVANPVYRSPAFTTAFDRQEGMSHLHNWLFLTGSVPQLEHTWTVYGLQVGIVPAGSMVAHQDLAFIIDGNGHERAVLDSDPGNGASSSSSFSSLLVDQINQVLPR